MGENRNYQRRKTEAPKVKRKGRRIQPLAVVRQLDDVEVIPPGAVLADPSQQVPNNSYSPPPSYYVDKEFVCVDCGRVETWLAQQQKWYYEVAKGSLYAAAIRCRECRQQHAEQHRGHGDPRPIKHLGTLMKRIRATIEPGLIAAGFQFDGKDKVTTAGFAWLDYSRPGLIVRCLFDRHEGRLIAETVDERAEYRIVANVEMNKPRSTNEVLERVGLFTSALGEFLRSLPT